VAEGHRPPAGETALVGRVARPHGLRGQVVVDPETDFPDDRFRLGAELLLVLKGTVAPVRITSVRFYKGRPIVAFDGIADATAAGALAGAELRVPVAWLTPLPPGSIYRHDLVGCEVQTADGGRVGTVKGVEGELGASRLVVDGPSGEILVPLAAEICREIDLPARRITIDPPEGLLELNVTARQARTPKRAAVRTRVP
jgi:16S rRNA processing protein RimM